MRRHTILDADAPQLPPLPQHFPPQQPQQQQQPQQEQQPQQPPLPLPPHPPQEVPRVSVSASISETPSTSLTVPAQTDGDIDTSTRLDPDDADARPDTPPIQDETPKHRRFSILRFRNASDSQLSLRAKQQAEKPPPVPRRVSPPVPLRHQSAPGPVHCANHPRQPLRLSRPHLQSISKYHRRSSLECD